MKTWILAALMMVAVNLQAQKRDGKHEPLKPEQRAELQAKKMTLALNLNDRQQKDVQKVLLDRNRKAEQFRADRKANREAGKKLTADERFAMASKRLDGQIAMKSELKRILSPEQFSNWEAMKKERHQKITKRHKNFRKEHRR